MKYFGGISNVKALFGDMGEDGTKAFNSISQAVLKTNTGLKQSNKALDELATSFFNSAKWAATTAAVNTITSSVQKAWAYSLKLDTSLNEIRIVTGKSADEMERFATTANRAAKELGASTLDYTKAALIYYQQGLGEEEVQARANVTLKVANVTGQSGDEVSEQLTAVWNGYRVSADEAELYMDKLSAVAAATASDLEELSTGMAKVASSANTMGVDIDQLNAQIATIVSVTRQAPESVGTALKTIYARMSDIEAGTEEEGVTLGNYTSQMAEMGVKVLDSQNKLRDMGEVIEEVGNKWKTYSREQQVALAQTMAGTRQYNNLISLFDNWSMYTEALDTSKNSAGELQRQQDIYMESTEAYLQKLATEAERTYDILFDDSAVKTMTSALTGMLSVLNSFFLGTGGGTSTLSVLGLSAVNIFSEQISKEMERLKENKRKDKQDRENYQEQQNWTKLSKTEKVAVEEGNPESIKKAIQYYQEQLTDKRPFLSESIIEEAEKNLKVLEQASKNLEALQTLPKLFKRFEIGGEDAEYYQAGLNRIIDEGTFEREKEPIINAIRNYQNLLGSLSESEDYIGELVELLDELNDKQIAKNQAYDRIPKNIQFFESEIQKNNKKLASYKNPEGAWAQKIKGKNEELEDSVQSLRLQQSEFEKDLAKRSIEQVVKDLETTWSDYRTTIPEADSNEIERAFKELKESITRNESVWAKDYVDHYNQFIQLLNDKLAEAQSAEKIANKVYKENSSQVKKGKSLGTVSGEQKATIGQASTSLEESINQTLGIKQRQDLIRGLSTIASSLISVTGIVKTLGNESLSAGEKATAAFTTLLMITAQLSTNFSSIKAAIPTLAERMSNVKDKVVSTSEKSQAAGGAIQLFSKTKKEKDTTTSQGLSQLAKDFGTTTKAALATKVAIGGLIVPVGAMLAVAAAVAGVIALVVYKVTETERAAKEAQEQLDAMNQVLNDTTVAFNSLKSSIEEYGDALEALEKLKEGTDEWQESVDSLNEKMIALMETYPELASMMTLENGMYTFNEDALEDYLDAQQQKVNNAKISQLYASNANTLAQQDLKSTQGARDVRGQGAVNGWAIGLGITAALAAGIGAFFTGGTSALTIPAILASVGIGAGTGLATKGLAEAGQGATGNFITADQYQELIEKVADNPDILENSESLKEAGYIGKALRDSILDSKATILQQAQELRNNTEQLKIRNQQIAATNLNKSAYYQGLDDQNEKDIISLMYQRYMNSEEFEKLGEENFKRGTDKTLQKNYAAYMGWENVSIDNQWGKAAYTYTEDGEEKTVTLLDDTVEKILRAEAANRVIISGQQVQLWDEIAKDLLDLAGENEDYEKILSAMVGGNDANLNSLSKKEINDFIAAVRSWFKRRNSYR